MHAVPSNCNSNDFSPLSLSGSCGYQINADRILVNVGEIANHREAGNVSGTLSLELWALDSPYAGQGFAGTALCATRICELLGQHYLSNLEFDLAFLNPPPGTWYLTLMLREWEGEQYITRSHLNFAQPYVVKARSSVSQSGNVITVAFGSNSSTFHREEDASAFASTLEAVVDQPRKEKPDHDELIQVSLNTASPSEIATLKGISMKVAENIVAARPYESVDEVLKIKGIGEKLFAKIRKLIQL